MTFTARAHSNIALIKYWGKSDRRLNMPAVPSLSLTLDALFTETSIEVLPPGQRDEVQLDGRAASDKVAARVVALLDNLAGSARPAARVVTYNNFPTAGGLASSASGFAALAVAANGAFNRGLSPQQCSAIARQASASAARSLFGGYVKLDLGAPFAEPLLTGDLWPLRLLVVLTATGPKSVASTAGMLRTQETSPFYSAWTTDSARLFESGKHALAQRDLPALGAAMEHSTLMMHATMLSSVPPVIYFNGATLAAIREVQRARSDGMPAYFTMDAGPHVKVLTEPSHAEDLAVRLRALDGVSDVLICAPGPDAHALAEPTLGAQA